MNDLAYWTRKLQEAERELDAATKRTEVNEAARRLMRVKAELRTLERQTATRRASGGSGARDFLLSVSCPARLPQNLTCGTDAH